MKKFDIERINQYINDNQDKIEEVFIGMFEDFFWTGVEYFSNSKFTNEEFQESSDWATPVMKITFKNGKALLADSYIDDGIETTRDPLLIRLLTSGEMTREANKYLSLLDRTSLDELI